MNPSITQQERIRSLDIIRGFALFGILLINVGTYQMLVEGAPMPVFSKFDRILDTLVDIFIEKKFFSIFSFLFGVGFYIFASRAEARGDKPRWRFTRRLLALFMIGIVHSFIFHGSILTMYAAIGLFLLPFYRMKVVTIRNWLFGIIIVHIVSILGQIYLLNIDILPTVLNLLGNDPIIVFMISAISAVLNLLGDDQITIFIMFLTGFLVAKAEWIGNVRQHAKQIKWVLYVMLPLFSGIASWIWYASKHHDQKFYYIISLGIIPTTYIYLACLFLILEKKKIIEILQPIGRVGQMAFTNYFVQSYIGLAIISLMGLEVLSISYIFIIAVIIFVIQVIFSVIWFTFFKMGPLEQVWRWMTYGIKIQKK